MRNLLKNQKGFTLVELLAVIVILAIISTIAVPAIEGLIHKTKDKATVSEAIQIINAAKMYVAAESPSKNIDLNDTKLSSYLNNVNHTGYTVVYDSTSGKYSYEIKDHSACALSGGTGATDRLLTPESDLLAYNNPSSTQ